MRQRQWDRLTYDSGDVVDGLSLEHGEGFADVRLREGRLEAGLWPLEVVPHQADLRPRYHEADGIARVVTCSRKTFHLVF